MFLEQLRSVGVEGHGTSSVKILDVVFAFDSFLLLL